MDTVHFDAAMGDEERRRLLYAGRLFVASPKPAALELCAFARQMLEEAFPGLDPRRAQHSFAAERYAEVLGVLKPRFIHHPRCKELVREILREQACDLESTYFDVPRVRTSTSDDYLTTGIAYAWHPHRDTWYSAPACQVNWWTPAYELASENAMAFHPQYWGRAVENDSRGYDYGEWNTKYRFAAEKHTKADPRPLPRSSEPMTLEPQVRLLPPVGGLILFSGAQMHSSVPNTSGVTRVSIDFRTVNIEDVRAHRGAPNVDARCTGTNLGDFLRASDLAPMPPELVEDYDRRSREA